MPTSTNSKVSGKTPAFNFSSSEQPLITTPFVLAVPTGLKAFLQKNDAALTYKVYVYTGSTLVTTASSSSNIISVSGLSNGTAYTVKGSIITVNGESSLSQSSNSVTPTALPIAGMSGEFIGIYVADGQAYSDTNVMSSGWTDSSGNGNTMTAVGTAFTFRTNIINGHSVARASTSCMKAPISFKDLGGSITIYLAYQQDSATNPQNYGVIMTQKASSSSPGMNQLDTGLSSVPATPGARILTQNGIATDLSTSSTAWCVRSFVYPGDGAFTNGVKTTIKMGAITFQKGLERNARTRAYKNEFQPTGLNFGNIPGTSNYFKGDFAVILIGYGAHTQATRWANEAALATYLGLSAPAQQ